MQRALEKIIRFIVHETEPERIILFGSVAAGRYDIHSDIDLLVVAPRFGLRKKLEQRISTFARECAVKADVLIRSQQEIRKAAEQPLSFLNSILSQGKTVYQNKG